MELVISISRIARFGRRGGSAFEAITTLSVPQDNSAPKTYTSTQHRLRAVSSIAHRLPLKQLVQWIVGLRKHPRMLVHAGMAAAIIAVVVIGALNAREGVSAPLASETAAPLTGIGGAQNQQQLVDKTASAFIAAGVASQLDMPIANDVAKQAESLTSQTAQPQVSAADNYLQKPQVTTTGGNTRDLRKYAVVEGDSVDSIAQKFNLTSDTIRWANNIHPNAQPAPGQELTILPVNGVLHTVLDNETAEGLALVFHSSADQIVSFNDAEVSGLKPGQQVIIPGGTIDQAFVATVASSPSASFRPSFAGNGYDFGYCTWYAANRRAGAGKSIPSNWGNASSWLYNAQLSGFKVSGTPVAGAVAWEPIGGLGHVAYVDSVNPDGSVNISEMNRVGWGRQSTRTVPASAFRYIY